MNDIPKFLIDEYIRVCDKYWSTGDTDLLDKQVNVAREIESKTKIEWSVWSDILTALRRLKVNNEIIYNILNTIGFEVIDE